MDDIDEYIEYKCGQCVSFEKLLATIGVATVGLLSAYNCIFSGIIFSANSLCLMYLEEINEIVDRYSSENENNESQIIVENVQEETIVENEQEPESEPPVVINEQEIETDFVKLWKIIIDNLYYR